MAPTNCRPIEEDELDAAAAALSAVVGEAEAAKPTLSRRLCRFPDGAFGLVVNGCFPISHALDREHPWVVQNGMAVLEIGYPIAEAVSLLASPDNPELEVARRRRLNEEHEQEKREREEGAKRAAAEAEANRVRDIADAEKYHQRSFEGDFSELGRNLWALALLVEGRDRELADDLRVLAEHQRVALGNLTNRLDFPRVEWNKRPRVSTGWEWWLRATDKPSV
jgi:hypothetical protein